MISTKILYNAVLKTEQVDDLHKAQQPPQPVGSYPYRLDFDTDLGGMTSKKMVFHMVGDTGGVKHPGQTHPVAEMMSKQFLNTTRAIDQPAFLYHLGDIVYHYGEADQYSTQFLQPFEHYPAPIYAIAGNHDSDVNPECENHYDSLEAFYTTFCNTQPATIHFGEMCKRKSQAQPHVYWSMQTPLATIIGLHTNVPKHGYISKEQKSWFIDELRHAAQQHADKAIIVCMHHAPYSADSNHGSSIRMIEFLDSAIEESGVKPDAVFSGHVHNYQRFNKKYSDGKTLPFIVAGAGGFEELHQLADPEHSAFTTESELLDDVELVNYCDNKHGFLKITIEKTPFNFAIHGQYHALNGEDTSLFDHFSIDLTGR